MYLYALGRLQNFTIGTDNNSGQMHWGKSANNTMAMLYLWQVKMVREAVT
jgi:hypothetical protein